MTSKPNKPAIFPGDGQGVPFPKGLDSVDQANDLIAQNVQMNDDGMNKEAAGRRAQRAVARVRELGRVPKIGFDELTETDIEFRGRRIHTTAADNRSWVQVGGGGVAEGSMRAAFDAVSLIPFTDEYGNSYSEVVYWAEVTKSELAENQEQIDNLAAEHAEIEKADAELRRLIGKAITYQTLPQGTQWIGMRPVTLDEAIALKEETGAEVELRRGNVFYVRATSEAALLEAASKLKSPPKFLPARIKGFDNKVQLLIFLLDQLGSLAVEWVKTGKRPQAETDIKQPANTLASNGAWLP